MVHDSSDPPWDRECFTPCTILVAEENWWGVIEGSQTDVDCHACYGRIMHMFPAAHGGIFSLCIRSALFGILSVGSNSIHKLLKLSIHTRASPLTMLVVSICFDLFGSLAFVPEDVGVSVA